MRPFNECSELTTVILGDGLEEIGAACISSMHIATTHRHTPRCQGNWLQRIRKLNEEFCVEIEEFGLETMDFSSS